MVIKKDQAKSKKVDKAKTPGKIIPPCELKEGKKSAKTD
jgi:hypothetical protein